MIPTVGRVVHYTKTDDKDLTPQAAIITAAALHNQFYEGQPKPDSEENKYRVSLHVFVQQGFNSGSMDLPQIPWSNEPKRGHWHWPPRVGQ